MFPVARPPGRRTCRATSAAARASPTLSRLCHMRLSSECLGAARRCRAWGANCVKDGNAELILLLLRGLVWPVSGAPHILIVVCMRNYKSAASTGLAAAQGGFIG